MLPPDDSPPPVDDVDDGLAAPPDDGDLSAPRPEDTSSTDTTVIGALTAPATIDDIIAMLNDLSRALRAIKARASPPTK